MYRILVVDDERLILNLLREALTRFGYQVETASSIRQAVFLFDREPFDLVITDILMPDGDGVQIAKHVHDSRRPGIPVLGTSGTPWLLERNCFEMVLSKPFTLGSLRNAVEELLTHPLGAFRSPVGRKTVANI